jgi:mannitol/fructose-specific phosphotransferase system IIA component (Ntr-type)
MMLDRIIDADRVMIGVSDTDKWTLLEDLADLVARSAEGADREVLITDTLDRENKGSTGIGGGIAIPHARTSGVPELVGALAVSRDGVDFEAGDGKPCHLIFLILAPHEETSRYLRALSAVAAIGKDPERMERLTAASSPEEAVSVLGEVGGGNS